jgi:multiple sugar transport system ATP-binding protein
MASSIKLEKIVKRYGSLPVIHGIDLQIEPGEFTVFVGPSGCGKSTLLRMIAGLEEISGGELRIDGERVNETAASKRGIAMVFQSYALYPHMSVYKNLAFGLETAGYKKPEIEARVKKAADILQIGPLLQRKPKALSGGQRQRVAIGRAIVREPKIFLFDEPLSNLDAELRVQMRVEIAKLHQTLGSTMIYVTHDQVEAMTMADKIAVLRAGKLEQFGVPLDLYNRPANLFVAGFIGSPKMNFFAGEVISGPTPLLKIATGELIPLPQTGFSYAPGQKVTLGIRPNHVKHGSEGPLTMSVRTAEQLGGESYLYGNLGDGTPVTLHLSGQTSTAAGEVIRMAAPLEHVHLFDTTSGLTLKQDV